MPPLAQPIIQRDPRIPAMLPRGCGGMVEIRADGWPVLLLIPADSGLLDPCCGYWHGTAAANGDRLSPGDADGGSDSTPEVPCSLLFDGQTPTACEAINPSHCKSV